MFAPRVARVVATFTGTGGNVKSINATLAGVLVPQMPTVGRIHITRTTWIV